MRKKKAIFFIKPSGKESAQGIESNRAFKQNDKEKITLSQKSKIDKM